jgi:hypothetical protein
VALRAADFGQLVWSWNQLIDGSPILTISLGGARVFRMREYHDRNRSVDIPITDGVVIAMPFAQQRRISITLRASV